MPVPVVVPDPALPTLVAPPSPAAQAFDPAAPATAELDRQLTVYADLGVPDLLGATTDALRALVAPLAGVAAGLDPAPRATVDDDAAPFVLVLPQVPVVDLVPAMRRGARAGVSVIDADEAATYRPLPGLVVPDEPYLLWGVDTGSDLRSVRPQDALETVRGRGRTPLTMAEGVALVVVRPDLLRPNRCFSLAGSRTGTNQRVPAVWISDRRPKLGWCWDGNPHTWLGTASAAGRAGAGDPGHT
jgi:hypothetical protein